jgi:hypothetical protein
MYTSVTTLGPFCHLLVSDADVANPTWHVYKRIFFSSRFPPLLHRFPSSLVLLLSSFFSIDFHSSLLLLSSICCLFQTQHNANWNSNPNCVHLFHKTQFRNLNLKLNLKMSKPNPNSWQTGQSSNGSVGSNLRRRVATQCRCGDESVIRTVMDSSNPNCGRKFWGCRNYKNSFDKGCSFFKLIEEDYNEDSDNKSAKLEKKNLKLKTQLQKTRSWLKLSLIFGLTSFGLCLVLGTTLVCKMSGTWSLMYLK